MKLLQSRVQRVKVPEGTVLPAGFEVWKVEDSPKDPASGNREMVIDASPEAWASLPMEGERLSLDDIFISCVGVAAKQI